MSMTRLLFLGLLFAATPACQRTSPAEDAAVATSGADGSMAPGSPPAATAEMIDADGGEISYRCEDGDRITARYGGNQAFLHWPGGRVATLPRAESASKGGGDVYVGDTVSLQRDGDRIVLHDGDAGAVACVASAA